MPTAPPRSVNTAASPVFNRSRFFRRLSVLGARRRSAFTRQSSRYLDAPSLSITPIQFLLLLALDSTLSTPAQLQISLSLLEEEEVVEQIRYIQGNRRLQTSPPAHNSG